MGIQINGNNDIISALDGSWTAEGASINTSGILTATTFKGNIVGTALGFDKQTQYNTIIDQGAGQIWFYREVNGVISVRIPIDSNTTLESENEGKKNLISVGDGQSVVIIIRQSG